MNMSAFIYERTPVVTRQCQCTYVFMMDRVTSWLSTLQSRINGVIRRSTRFSERQWTKMSFGGLMYFHTWTKDESKFKKQREHDGKCVVDFVKSHKKVLSWPITRTYSCLILVVTWFYLKSPLQNRIEFFLSKKRLPCFSLIVIEIITRRASY